MGDSRFEVEIVKRNSVSFARKTIKTEGTVQNRSPRVHAVSFEIDTGEAFLFRPVERRPDELSTGTAHASIRIDIELLHPQPHPTEADTGLRACEKRAERRFPLRATSREEKRSAIFRVDGGFAKLDQRVQRGANAKLFHVVQEELRDDRSIGSRRTVDDYGDFGHLLNSTRRSWMAVANPYLFTLLCSQLGLSRARPILVFSEVPLKAGILERLSASFRTQLHALRPCAALVLLSGCQGNQEPPSPRIYTSDADLVLKLPDESTGESLARSMEAVFLPPSDMPSAAQRISLAPEKEVQWNQPLGANECLHLLARLDGPPSGQPLGLRIRNEEGKILAADEENDGVAAISSWCSTSEQVLRVEAQSSIAGELLVTTQVTPGSPTEVRISDHAQRWLPGFRAVGPVHRYVLANNQRVELPIAMRNDACYGVVVAADGGLEDIDVRLLSLTGEQMALEVSTAADAFVGPYCPVHDSVVRVEFRAYKGQGAFDWQVFDIGRAAGETMLRAREASPDGIRGWE